MGCSSRTSTRVTRLSLIHSLTKCNTREEHGKEVAQRVADEFIDSLEELRKAENVKDFMLAGHSLGGYLCSKYAVKYPEEVKGLILISPVGIPEQPAKEDRVEPHDIDWRIRFMTRLWTLNVTPQALVRILGKRGPALVENYITKRFSNHWEGPELKLISDYFYHVTASPGNGEYCINALLEPIFVKEQTLKNNRSPAREGEANHPESEEEDKLNEKLPLRSYRTGVFAKNPVEKELTACRFPILLIYGDHDWLYYPGASKSVELWRQNGVPGADLAIVPNAGHHLYIDNSKDFNQLIIDWTKSVKY
jgi:pimeloyl-ACP methyl ester carboxylesterase